MKKQLCILVTFCLTTIVNLNAQVGIGTNAPAASSILDVTSTSKGVLIPRMTAAQRGAIGTPAEGLMVYQTNAPTGLWIYLNGAWTRLASTADLLTFGQSSAFAASTGGQALVAALGYQTIQLPDAQSLGALVTKNAANTVFTVTQGGRYRIAYRINATAGILTSSRVLINNAENIALSYSPAVGVSTYSAEAIVNLAAGSTISLQLGGLLSVILLLDDGQGAALTIQRLE